MPKRKYLIGCPECGEELFAVMRVSESDEYAAMQAVIQAARDYVNGPPDWARAVPLYEKLEQALEAYDACTSKQDKV